MFFHFTILIAILAKSQRTDSVMMFCNFLLKLVFILMKGKTAEMTSDSRAAYRLSYFNGYSMVNFH